MVLPLIYVNLKEWLYFNNVYRNIMSQCNNCNGSKKLFSFCGEMWPGNFVIGLKITHSSISKYDPEGG